MPQKPLDVSALKGIVEANEKKEKEKIKAKIKNKNYPTEPRDYETWFRLPSRFADCSQGDDCLDPRVDKEQTGKTMVANVNGNDICRYCFLAGASKPNA